MIHIRERIKDRWQQRLGAAHTDGEQSLRGKHYGNCLFIVLTVKFQY